MSSIEDQPDRVSLFENAHIDNRNDDNLSLCDAMAMCAQHSAARNNNSRREKEKRMNDNRTKSLRTWLVANGTFLGFFRKREKR